MSMQIQEAWRRASSENALSPREKELSSFISVDYAQVEKRALASMELRVKVPPHLATMEAIASYVDSAGTKDERQRRKDEVFHLMYGGRL